MLLPLLRALDRTLVGGLLGPQLLCLLLLLLLRLLRLLDVGLTLVEILHKLATEMKAMQERSNQPAQSLGST